MVSHTFAICAYKQSPYLEECICSLTTQTVKSNIIIATSTPNDHIKALAEKYHLPLYINQGESGIAQDWNFAYRQAKTDYVTIAHQDDYYQPEYLENILNGLKCAKDPIIAFSDYGELRNGQKVDRNQLLTIKRILLLPLRIKGLWKSVRARRLCLSLGNPVCCPSTTYVKKKFPEEPFQVKYASNVDWMMLERASKYKGEFCYVTKVSMYHRIHEESTTSEIIGNNARGQEDFEMFCRFWPKGIAKIIARVYGTSEKSNNI